MRDARNGEFKEPIVHFQDARVTGLGVTGGSVEVLLSVYNPNGFKLDGERLTYNAHSRLRDARHGCAGGSFHSAGEATRRS